MVKISLDGSNQALFRARRDKYTAGMKTMKGEPIWRTVEQDYFETVVSQTVVSHKINQTFT